ncbi:hypothetical protein WSPTPLR_03510 [Wolbachia pipientis]|nr:hypothetical protein WPAU_0628 [Wolbachia endosymbiont of Drosophila simulans wAu]
MQINSGVYNYLNVDSSILWFIMKVVFYIEEEYDEAGKDNW